MRKDLVDVQVAGGTMRAHRWLPDSGEGPGILLLQEIFGVSDYIERRAADLAAAGYVVLAPEIFWRLGHTRVENGPDALEEAMGLVQRLDWSGAVGDGAEAFRTLTGLAAVTGKSAILGFCFGGGLSFAVAAQTEPQALVSFYGSALPNLLDLAPRVGCPQLHHFGLADSYMSAAQVVEIEQAVAGPNTTFHTYEGADHAFDNDDLQMLHHPEASALAWERTLGFLRRRLG